MHLGLMHSATTQPNSPYLPLPCSSQAPWPHAVRAACSPSASRSSRRQRRRPSPSRSPSPDHPSLQSRELSVPYRRLSSVNSVAIEYCVGSVDLGVLLCSQLHMLCSWSGRRSVVVVFCESCCEWNYGARIVSCRINLCVQYHDS
mgnify:CR=1 FL=1